MLDLLSTDFILKFLKFGVVGFSGVFVDFATTFVCKERFKVQKYISNAIGFTVAASTNYILNRIWTFQSHNPQIATEYIKFLSVSMIGLAVNTFILWALVSKYNKHFYVSKLFAIAVVTIWNFVANLLFTFTV